MKALEFTKKYWKYIAIFVTLAIIGLIAYSAYQKYTAKPVTYESQSQAQSLSGVKLAADNAKVSLDNSQASEIAKAITDIAKNNTTPLYSVNTTGSNVASVAASEAKKNNADFAIVTEPSKPDVAVDTSKIANDAPVTLNQYNIQAYKKTLHQVDIDFNASGVNEVNYSVSRKISDGGKYIGYVVGYNKEYKEAKVGIRYTW